MAALTSTTIVPAQVPRSDSVVIWRFDLRPTVDLTIDVQANTAEAARGLILDQLVASLGA